MAIVTGQQSIPDNTVVSTSNRMFLKFKTDSSVTYPGFELRFYAVHESTLPISSKCACAWESAWES